MRQLDIEPRGCFAFFIEGARTKPKINGRAKSARAQSASRDSSMIVTLDGPAGVGKSSVAKTLALRLDFEFLDTGAMYRTVALAARDAGIDLTSEPALADLLSHIRLGFRPVQAFLNGVDVTERIRDPAVTRTAGVIAQSPAVRAYLVKLQRLMAAGRNMVTEGRDQGTVVFPDAQCKFYLTAEPDERARRRVRDLASRGIEVTLAEVRSDQDERDRRDAARAVGPMKPAEDAILVDTTGMTLDQVADFLEEEIDRRRSAP
jgi:CMP/dCMP kinase